MAALVEQADGVEERRPGAAAGANRRSELDVDARASAVQGRDGVGQPRRSQHLAEPVARVRQRRARDHEPTAGRDDRQPGLMPREPTFEQRLVSYRPRRVTQVRHPKRVAIRQQGVEVGVRPGHDRLGGRHHGGDRDAVARERIAATFRQQAGHQPLTGGQRRRAPRFPDLLHHPAERSRPRQRVLQANRARHARSDDLAHAVSEDGDRLDAPGKPEAGQGVLDGEERGLGEDGVFGGGPRVIAAHDRVREGVRPEDGEDRCARVDGLTVDGAGPVELSQAVPGRRPRCWKDERHRRRRRAVGKALNRSRSPRRQRGGHALG